MTEQTRTEQLYMTLIDTLNELAELESPEVIFDFVVDNFASEAEYHSGKANTFKGMLDAFRHDNPAETIPEEPQAPSVPDAFDMFGGINDINRQYMLEDRDKLMEFLNSAHFPDTLDS